MPTEAVVSCVDAPSIYEIPMVLHEEGLDDYVCRLLGFTPEHGYAAEPDLTVRALRAELLARGISVSYGAVWAFIRSERLSFKKKLVRRGTATPGRGPQAAPLAALPGPH